MRFRLIEDHRDVWAVRVMCDALSVSASGDYAWRSRPQSPRASANRELLIDIQRVHAQHRERYGAPRIQPNGAPRAKPSVASGSNGSCASMVSGLARRYRVCTTDSKHSLPGAENLLDQNFVADRPDQVWLADLTEILSANSGGPSA